jgi:hypothetical protein
MQLKQLKRSTIDLSVLFTSIFPRIPLALRRPRSGTGLCTVAASVQAVRGTAVSSELLLPPTLQTMKLP